MKQRNAARRHSKGSLHGSSGALALRDGSLRPPILTPSPNGPPCPQCGLATKRRARKKDARAFWGCPRFPLCRGAVALDARPAMATHTTIPPPIPQDGDERAPLERIRRRRHRNFAAQVVERTRAGDSFDDVLLGAGRSVFRSSYRVSDEAMRERAKALLNREPIWSVVRALLGADA